MEKKIMYIRGTVEAVEDVIRIFDKVFRSRYNVYGGKREESYYINGTYFVRMSYEAEWNGDPGMRALFPEYSWEGVKRGFYRQTLHLPDTEEYWFDYNEGRA